MTVRRTLVKEAKDPSRCLCVILKVRFPLLSSLMVPWGETCSSNLVFLFFYYISVHPTDPTRLELIIPGEQHFYVRAVNAAERQKWLVALGSSKAGTLDSHKHKGAHRMLKCPSALCGFVLWLEHIWWTLLVLVMNQSIRAEFWPDDGSKRKMKRNLRVIYVSQ